MTTLDARPNTALLVVDVQNDVVGEAYERDAVVGRVGGLVERARSEGVPVVWVQHVSEHIERGSDGWRIVSELAPPRTRRSSTSGTATLSRTPSSRRCSRGWRSGGWSSPPPDQVIAHTNLYWTDQTAPARTAGTATAEDVDLGAAQAATTVPQSTP